MFDCASVACENTGLYAVMSPCGGVTFLCGPHARHFEQGQQDSRVFCNGRDACRYGYEHSIPTELVLVRGMN